MCGLVPYAQSVLSGYAVWYLGFGTVGYKGAERYDMPPPVLENTYPADSKMPSEAFSDGIGTLKTGHTVCEYFALVSLWRK